MGGQNSLCVGTSILAYGAITVTAGTPTRTGSGPTVYSYWYSAGGFWFYGGSYGLSGYPSTISVGAGTVARNAPDGTNVGTTAVSTVYKVTVAKAAAYTGASVSASNSGLAVSGQSVTVSASNYAGSTSAPGWSWASWSDSGAQSHAITPADDMTVTATFTQTTFRAYFKVAAGQETRGTIRSGDAANTVASRWTSGSYFAAGAAKWLTVTAAAGWTFDGFYLTGGDTKLSGGATTLSAQVIKGGADETFEARFVTNQFALTVTSAGNGTVAGGGTKTAGASVTITATPATHYAFALWTGTGISNSTSASYTFTMPWSVVSAIASFVQNEWRRYLAVNNSAMGSLAFTNSALSSGFYIQAGVWLDVTVAVTHAKYRLASWTLNGQTVTLSAIPNTTNRFLFKTTTEDQTLTAVFEQYQWTKTITAGANGSVSAKVGTLAFTSGSLLQAGVTLQVIATPNSHYAFSKWQLNTADQNPTTKPATANFTTAEANETFNAVFAQSEWPKYLAAYTGHSTWGTVSGFTSGSWFAAGVTKTLIATVRPSYPDYRFKKWVRSVGGVETDVAGGTASMSVTFASTVETWLAQFEKYQWTKTITAGANGSVSAKVGTVAFASGSILPAATSLVVIAVANTHYVFSKWQLNTVDQNPTTKPATATFSTAAANETFNAVFAQSEWQKYLAAYTGHSTWGTVSGFTTGSWFATGVQRTIVATVSASYPDYRFKKWVYRVGTVETDVVGGTASMAVTFGALGETWLAQFEKYKWTMTFTVNNATMGYVEGGTSALLATGAIATREAKSRDPYKYRFTGWYNASNVLVSTSATTSFGMSGEADIAYQARFVSTLHAVTLAVSPSGAGSVSGAASYYETDWVTITATPAYNYTFAYWSGAAPVSQPTQNPTGFYMPQADTSTTAYFTIRPSFTIAASKDNPTYGSLYSARIVNGVIAGWFENALVDETDFSFTGYTDVTYRVMAILDSTHADYAKRTFNGWYADGVKVSSSITYDFTKTTAANISLVAKFADKPSYTAASAATSGGTCSFTAPTPDFTSPNRWLAGRTITYTAAPSTGYYLSSWSIFDTSGNAANNSTIPNPATNTLEHVIGFNVRVTANFARFSYLVTASAGTGGSASFAFGVVTVAQSQKVFHGDSVTFTAVAAGGNVFSRWQSLPGYAQASTSNPFVYGAVTSAVSMLAKFKHPVALGVKLYSTAAGTVKLNSGTAGATASGFIEMGVSFTATAIPGALSRLDAWYAASDTGFTTPLSTKEAYTLSSTSAVSLVARFTPTHANVSVTPIFDDDGHDNYAAGTVTVDAETPSGTTGVPVVKSVAIGGTCTIKAVPKAVSPKSEFDAWYLASDIGFASPLQYAAEQIIKVAAPVSLAARFLLSVPIRYLAVYNYDAATEELSPDLGVIAVTGGTEISEIAFKNGIEEQTTPTGVAGHRFFEFSGTVATAISVTPQNAQKPFTKMTIKQIDVVAGEAVYGTETDLTTSMDLEGLLMTRNFIIKVYYGTSTPVPVMVSASYAEDCDETMGVFTLDPETDERAEIFGGLTDMVTQLETATLSAGIKNGYLFAGWFDNYEGTGTPLSTSAVYAFTVIRAMALYAKFTVDPNAVYLWEGTQTNKMMTWRSKRYVAARPVNFSAARIYADSYPVTLAQYVASSPDAPASDTPSSIVPCVSQDGRRLPMGRPEKYVEIEVQSAQPINEVAVSTSMGGLTP